MLARSEHPLPADVLASPCLSAALALIAHDEHVPDAALRSAGASPAWLLGGGSAGAAEDAWGGGARRRTARTAWRAPQARWAPTAAPARPHLGRFVSRAARRRARRLWEPRHRPCVGAHGGRAPRNGPPTSARRTSPSSASSPGGAPHSASPPSFAPRRSDVLPHEPRVWFEAGRERPHTRPSRAALLVRLAHLAPYERLIDPCGGVGVLALEAARRARRISRASRWTSTPPRAKPRHATRGARPRAADSDAPPRLSPGSTVCVVAGDALRCPFANGSFDVAVADLPFGMRHAKLDVGALMRELARVLKPRGGRALLFGSAGGGGGSADAVIKVAKVHQPNVWDVVERTRCSAAGVACEAVLLKLREGGGATSTSTSTDLQF